MSASGTPPGDLVRPPRLALLIVTLFAARALRDAVQGDLAERFTLMAREDVVAARRWYWYQAIRCLAPSHRLVVALPRRSPPGLVRRAYLGGILQDLRYAARGLLARPGFSVAAVLTLGIGIGATTAIFSVVNGVLLRPLPYAEPDRLVNVWQVNEEWFGSPNQGLRAWANSFPVSMPVLHDWEELSPVFESVGAYDDRTYTLLLGDRPEPVFGVRVSIAAPRFRTGLVSLFAVLAGLLAVIGVYGVLAYTMAQRTVEIGIRMALGANVGDVVRAVLRRGAVLAAAGLAIGVAMALATVRFLSSFLFETATYDAATFVAAAVLLALAALSASYLPARRATKVDPVEALRAE